MSTPIPVKTVRHQCPHCGRTWAKRPAATAHIARCWLNPAAKSCKTCARFVPAEPGPYAEHPGWPEECSEDQPLTNGLRTDCPLWRPTNA